MFWSKKNAATSTTTTHTTSLPSMVTSGSNFVYASNTASTGYVTVSAVGAGGAGGAGSWSIGTGSMNQVLTTSGWSTAPSSITMTGNVMLDSDTPYINTRKNKINLDLLIRNLEIVNDIFHIIVPDPVKLEKHPTLMDAFIQYDSAKHIEPRYNSEEYIAAYHQYKLLEALLEEEKNDNS